MKITLLLRENLFLFLAKCHDLAETLHSINKSVINNNKIITSKLTYEM